MGDTTTAEGDHPPVTPAKPARDDYVDLLRAFSLVVVVVWHWVFTVLRWDSDGPHASNPVGFVRGLWLLTWLLQVMPLFFFVGGFAHSLVLAQLGDLSPWRRWGTFVVGRAKRLVPPAVVLVLLWMAIGLLAVAAGWVPGPWARGAVILVLSPLWFLVVYLLLVVLAPMMLQLHRRAGPLVLVVMVGAVGLVDVLRFRSGVDGVAWVNLVLAWALVHQLGFFYPQLLRGPRVWSWCLAAGGLMALVGLVASGVYPGSMVGVPGDRISNMDPPTLCIVALGFFQAGVAMLIRPRVVGWLERPALTRASDRLNKVAMPLYLFHSSGMAVALYLVYELDLDVPTDPDTAAWWWSRPAWFLFCLLCSIPVIALGSRLPAKLPSGPSRRW